jgi:phage/plasmid-associated DNA primase
VASADAGQVADHLVPQLGAGREFLPPLAPLHPVVQVGPTDALRRFLLAVADVGGGEFAPLKLANICPEVGELDRTAEGTLKAFVSGDRMTFERKGKDAFSARPTARLVLSTNNVPRFADKSEGVWRRLLLAPFTRQVSIEERVAGMDRPEFWLRAGEAAGILNWALEGMRKLKEGGMRFVEPAACRAALAEHRADSDPCRAFLEEYYVADPQGSPVPAADLYGDYRGWCETGGFKAVSKTNFGRQVRRVLHLEESRTHRGPHGPVKAWFGMARRKPEA